MTSHSNILASGGNDNQAILWDLRKHSKLHKFKGHQGAVKALSWCPWRNGVLASGAGAGDRTIRIWNTN